VNEIICVDGFSPLDQRQKYGFIDLMKTTLEVPDELLSPSEIKGGPTSP